jgi:gliding motility-associated-like protein
VTVPNAGSPTITISSSTNVSCFGGSNGTANTTTSGGTSPYTYLWSPSAQTTANATGLSSGSYTVTVTDANGCSSTATVTITQPTQVTVSASVVSNVLCNGGNTGSANASGSGGTGIITYSWTPSAQTTATATGLSVGTYTVIATDANGCTAQTTVTITQPPVLTASTTQVNVLCNGNATGTSTVTAAGGTTPYAYSWSPSAQTSATATGLAAGTYTITVTDANGCTTQQTVTITQPTALALTTSFVQSTCSNPNGSATVNASGGNPAYSYSWNNGQTTATATGLLAATYTVVVTDANGCTAQATVTVPNAASPVASISASTNVSCFGGSNGTATASVTGGTAPYTYAWNPSAQTTATATGLSAGTYTVTVADANGCTSTATVTITQPTLLTVSISQSVNILCNGGNNGAATAAGAGGTPNYTYSWSNSQLTATATGLVAGTYTVVVTDANGCTAQTTVTITQPAVLAGTTTQVDVLCNGNNTGSATVNPTGGTTPYTYLWNPGGQTNATATGLTAGTYTVTVADANGCNITLNVTITQPTALNATMATTTAHCNQPDGDATITVSGGVGPYNYVWSNGQTTATATGLTPATYTCVVTDANGCTLSSTAIVPNAAGVAASIVTASNVTCNSLCDGSAGALATGGVAPYTYSWSTSPSQSTANATGLCAGTYTCLITDASGCFDTTIVVITQPQPLVIAPIVHPTICLGQSTTLTAVVTGGTPSYAYTWTPGNFNASSVTVSPTSTTTYTVTVTDINGCTSNAQTVVVTVNPPLAVLTNGTTSICIGASTSIGAIASGGNGGPYTYSWSPGGMTTSNCTVSPTTTTTYTVTVDDGCTNPLATSTVTITVNPLPVISFTTNPTPASGCAPLCVDFTCTTPNSASCSWNFQVGTSNNCTTNFCFTNAGQYDVTLTVVDNNGCTNSQTTPSLVTVYPNPVADFTMSPQPTTVMNGTIQFTDQSTGANAWAWAFGDVNNSSSNVQNPQFTYTDTGSFPVTLVVTSQYGCVDSITKYVRIDDDFSLYVPNAFTPNGDGKNDVFIPVGQLIDPNDYHLWIFDRWGNLIFNTDNINKGWDGTANGGTEIVQEDVYVWKIAFKDQTATQHSYVGHVSVIK